MRENNLKHFLKKAAIPASLAFCAVSFIVYNAFADGGSYGFSSSSVTLQPGATGSAGAIVRANDAGRTVAAGDAVFTGVDDACATVTFSPNNFGSAGTGGKINVNNTSGTSGDLPIGTVSISAKNVSVSCSTTVTIEGDLLDSADGDSHSSASLTIYVEVPAPEPPSSDNQIKGLISSTGTVGGSGTNWTVSGVPRDAASITLTPSLPKGASVQGGSPVTCIITDETSTCGFTVIAEDGTPKDYTVTITKKPEDTPEPEPEPVDPSLSDASLKSISADNDLIPGYSPDNTSYTINVSNSVTAMNFTAVPNVEGTTYTVSGASGWKVGVNVVKVTATAKDGTKKVYSINVVRAAAAKKAEEEKKKSSNNYLKTLTSHDGVLTPEFNKDTTTYSVKVPKDVTKLSLTAIAEDDKAKVEISGNSGFEVGKVHSVTVTVTAEDGSQRVYTINVTRMEQEAKTDLEDLEVDGYTLKPAFNKDVDKYSITVPYDTKEVDVTAIPADKDSRVEIIGNKDLEVGNNAVLVKVTDKNGFTHVYEINVRRLGEPTFLGIRRSIWWIILLIAALLLLFLFFLWLLFRRREDDDEEYVPALAPTIQFNPAFNFGSRVGTDDDTVMPNGVNNQAETVPSTTLAQPQNQLLNASTVRQNKALEEDETPSILREEPKTTATVNPQAAGVANATNMTPAMLAGAAADASMDEAEELAELRAEKRMREREEARKEAERELLAREAKEAEVLQSNEEPYDIYDETVTKDELYDALMDVKNKHDSSKLKILMRQEELNREKEQARKAESEEIRKKSARVKENAQDEFWG